MKGPCLTESRTGNASYRIGSIAPPSDITKCEGIHRLTRMQPRYRATRRSDMPKRCPAPTDTPKQLCPRKGAKYASLNPHQPTQTFRGPAKHDRPLSLSTSTGTPQAFHTMALRNCSVVPTRWLRIKLRKLGRRHAPGILRHRLHFLRVEEVAVGRVDLLDRFLRERV
jgi:hypothetical protein